MKLERATNKICSIAPHGIRRQEKTQLIVFLKADQVRLLLTNFSIMSLIFEKTIPEVQRVQTILSVQEFQVDPQMLVVVNVNITQPKLSYNKAINKETN